MEKSRGRLGKAGMAFRWKGRRLMFLGRIGVFRWQVYCVSLGTESQGH